MAQLDIVRIGSIEPLVARPETARVVILLNRYPDAFEVRASHGTILNLYRDRDFVEQVIGARQLFGLVARARAVLVDINDAAQRRRARARSTTDALLLEANGMHLDTPPPAASDPHRRRVSALDGSVGWGTNRVMKLSSLGARATAGSLRALQGVVLHHAWTEQGVVATPASNGAQVLHLSVALCVLNDTYREAQRLGVELKGVVVDADGDFDDEWRSTGIAYSVVLDTHAPNEDVTRLSDIVDQVAEIPRALRAGAAVTRRF